MEALLILTAVVMIAVAWVWLVASSLRLPVHRTVIAAALPFATLFLRDRGYPRAPRLMLVAGLLCGVAGIGVLYHQQPERFGALVSGDWLATAPAQTTLSGAIMGQPFNPDRGLWRGDELLFEEGPTNRIRRSIGIRFDVASQMMTEPTIERIPGDEEGWPELVLQWHGGALEPPGLRRVTTDYSLSLNFTPEQGGQAKVAVHMHLLPVHGTWMRGEMLLTDNPQWLVDLFTEQATKVVEAPAAQPTATTAPLAQQERTPHWDEISLLALLDEPRPYLESRLRVVTVSGRTHDGIFKGVTQEQRLVLSLPRGANQVELQFAPTDLERVESFSLR